jgi:hypothetical protein
VGVHLSFFSGNQIMLTKFMAPGAVFAGAILLAGCADNASVFGGGNNLTTASVVEPARTDPACVSLASQIEGLKREGVADRIAQASVKKYKMTTADLAKADQLNKANTEFQFKCSTVKPAGMQSAAVAPAQTQTPGTAAARLAPAVAAKPAAPVDP